MANEHIRGAEMVTCSTPLLPADRQKHSAASCTHGRNHRREVMTGVLAKASSVIETVSRLKKHEKGFYGNVLVVFVRVIGDATGPRRNK